MPATNIRIALGSGNDMSGLGRILVPAICTMGPDGQGTGMADIVCARASEVTGINALGQIVTYPANTPSYNNGNLQSLPVAGWTNYHPYSYDVSNWTTNLRLNITSPALVTDPAGTTRGFPLIPTANNSTHLIGQQMSDLTDNTIHNFSYYVLSGTPISGETKVWTRITTQLKDGSSIITFFNLTDVTIGTKDHTDAGIDGPYYGGYYRIWVSQDILSGATTPAAYLGIALHDNENTFVGDNSTVSFWTYGANVVEGTAPLPDIVTTGDVGVVAGQTLTADISTNTALRDALSDSDAADTDGESVFTMLAKITPRVNLVDCTVAQSYINVATMDALLSSDTTTDDFYAYDRTNTARANSSDTDPIAGLEQWVKITGDSDAGEAGDLQICNSVDSGVTWSCGDKAPYDGAMALGNNFIIGYNSPYAFDFGGVAFFNSVLKDAEARRAIQLIG
jgi:hypothetical protein